MYIFFSFALIYVSYIDAFITWVSFADAVSAETGQLNINQGQR